MWCVVVASGILALRVHPTLSLPAVRDVRSEEESSEEPMGQEMCYYSSQSAYTVHSRLRPPIS